MPDVTTDSAEAASTAAKLQGEAAFFDVDNTLMKGASLFHVARKMYQKKTFTLRDAAGFAWKQAKFILRGENMSDVHSIQDSAQKLAAGISADLVRHLGEEVYDEMIVSKIWPGTLALTQEHLKSGRQVWLVTATPVEVAGVIAQRLKLTGALGTVAEVDGGFYTGRIVGEILHGAAKGRAVRELAEMQGLDLARCWAYSDSYNDIPLLTTVGNPVAINPDARLRRHAREHNWPIYDYRSGRRAATLGLQAATGAGVVYGLWRGISSMRRK
ncbi:MULTISPECIES: HAD family phosphatase [unclassified Arthrobacter]|uniref:HAD family hydrolase n=1 Tax=unclassified Arthrobacter TaxID=235627 RepID=UPI00159E21F5|nr:MULTISPECIES: HAD-IB family hydrolase [unclassified Arthrobacter]MCQ9165130.1 HAD-IB family hydrolase [Arthrobacter sp. STN4]NVM99776.1 HAD-IB family hydrolase [Arthrobacter sp. SDTb3-6]